MRLVATAFALWLSACSCEAPRGMIVQLRSNFVPGIEFDEARTEVWSDGQRAPYLDTSRAMRWRDPVERGVQIADAAELAPGTYTVIVTLRRAGSAVAQRRVRVSYEGTWAVTVLVTRDCANVTCEDGLTCLAGVCVPQDCLTGSAFDGCPTVVCRQDADCEAPPIDCTDVMCLDGLCHPFPVHDECGDEEWCNPDEGCRVRPDEVRDAGVAPGDAGVPRCDEGCDDANPCTDDDCVAGRCVFAHNSEPCDDGRFCNGPDRCGGGRCVPGTTSPCPGASVCEETVGACTGCATDADCPAETVGGWGQCSFGDTCAADGTRSRTVTRYRCDAGTCAESRSTEMGACARASRDGVSCGTRTCPDFGPCGGFATECATDGTRSRTCTDRVCQAGACRDVAAPESSGCARATNGNACGGGAYCDGWGDCAYDDECDQDGWQTRTCHDFRCGSGACRDAPSTDGRGCSRSTENQRCGVNPTYCGRRVDCHVCRSGSCALNAGHYDAACNPSCGVAIALCGQAGFCCPSGSCPSVGPGPFADCETCCQGDTCF